MRCRLWGGVAVGGRVCVRESHACPSWQHRAPASGSSRLLRQVVLVCVKRQIKTHSTEYGYTGSGSGARGRAGPHVLIGAGRLRREAVTWRGNLAVTNREAVQLYEVPVLAPGGGELGWVGQRWV